MKYRRFQRSAGRRHRDLIWITTVFNSSTLEGAAVDFALLIVGTDWAKTNAFERATLLAVRGWYNLAQTTVGTSADATGGFLAIYKCESTVASPAMSPGTATDYDNVDILYTDGIAITASSSPAPPSTQVDIKVKRKITNMDSIRGTFQLDVDSAAPRINVVGCFRSLLQLDPPG